MHRPALRSLVILAVAVAAATVPAAQARYSYGQYAAGKQRGVYVMLEGIAVNPRNVDAIVATTESLDDSPGGVNSLMQVNPQWDGQFAGRLALGHGWPSGNKVSLTVWGFAADQESIGQGPSGGVSYFGIGPPIRTGGGYVGDGGSPGSWNMTTEIEAGAADLAFAREYDLDESFTLEWSAGLRYASYEETTRGGYDVASTLSSVWGQEAYAAEKSNLGEMFGVRVAGRGSFRFARVFSIDAALGFSFLDGQITSRSTLVPSGLLNAGATPAAVAEITDDSRSGETRDLELTVSWRIVGEAVRVWVGWEQQVWEGVASDLVRNFPGTLAPLRDRDSVTFSGYKLGLFVRF